MESVAGMAKAMLGSRPRHLMSSEYLGIRDSTAFALEGPANIRREQSQEAAEFHIKSLYFTQQACGLEIGGQATSLWTVARAPLSEVLSLGASPQGAGDSSLGLAFFQTKSPAFCVDAIDCHMSLRRLYSKH